MSDETNDGLLGGKRKALLKNTILMIVGFAILLYAASLGGIALLWGIVAVLLIMVLDRSR